MFQYRFSSYTDLMFLYFYVFTNATKNSSRFLWSQLHYFLQELVKFLVQCSYFLKVFCHKMFLFCSNAVLTLPAFTCSKLTIETLEQGVKYVQS